MLRGIVPDATTVVAIGAEDADGSPGTWVVEARAMCAPAPRGLERVYVRTEATDTDMATATATCPAGKHVLGTGANASAAQAIMLDDLRPDAALTSVSATALLAAHGQSGTIADFVLETWAIRASP